ncbi:MAG TPA: phytoene desaturase family protein [Chloroflexota bacterium]|nr:phytoene desaturase family protein [Chloroflexota bacterium]
MRKAIVIGAGLGGLATAARLQHQGYQVTVLEKNAGPGGRCDRFAASGYRFDTGPTILLMVDALREVFEAVDRDIHDYLHLVRLPFNYRIRFGDGTMLDVSSDEAAMRGQLEAIEPGAGRAYSRFLEDAAYKYKVARRRFTDRAYRSWAEFLSPLNGYYFASTRALVPMERFVGQYFRDPRLRLAFSFQTMYLGLSPRDAPAIYSLLPYTELHDGIWFPMGGMYEIPLALARLVEDLGGELRYDHAVEEVTVRAGRAVGVRMAGGDELAADLVVCNADLPQSYATLVPEAARGRFTERGLGRLRYGCSAFMLYLGVDKVYDHLFHHNVFLAPDPDANFSDIFRDQRLSSHPSFYLHCPARTDPLLAPTGGDALYVLVPVPHLGSAVDWHSEGPRFRERVLDHIAALAAPDIRDHLVVERMVTPADWADLYGLRHGATFGLAHDFFQVGMMRPANKARAVDRLYFVGAGTVPGGGVPMVLIGSRLVAERVLRDVGSGRS